MYASLFLTLGAMHLVALASPGPDVALILRSCQHRPLAIGAALGISLAILLHATLSLTGISLLIAGAPLLFTGIKLVGALYLGKMAWGALLAARYPSAAFVTTSEGAQGNLLRGVRQGMATNLLNPKALLFFMGLLAAMVTPEVETGIRLLLALELFILSLVWFLLLAWGLSGERAKGLIARAQRPINLITGLLFGAVSLSILWSLLPLAP
ncbi:LysE family translocator [Aeromonas schubertii]|nr:LysE family translocator [Aeromonas schubertii]MBZ6068175.1 LysE family translocator [Aeromonas schubertii]